MQAFHYKDKHFQVEDMALGELAQKHGTPLYVYSEKALRTHFTEMDQALSELNRLICFSVKANSNIAVLKTLVDLGAGLDIVSGGELVRALKAGCAPEKIVFAGVGKTEAEIEQAINAGIKMFNVESLPELERINDVGLRLGKKAPVSLRVNPDVDPKTHKYITTGKKENKFGLDFDQAIEIVSGIERYEGVDWIGIHAHIGSQITEGQPFVDSIGRMSAFFAGLEKRGKKTRVFNFGGGLGIVYDSETPQSFQEYGQTIVPLLKALPVDEIVFEPGRSIAGNAGVLLTEVQYLKQSGEKTFAIVDAAMNDLLRPSLYDAYHRIVPLEQKEGAFVVDIVGPICESGDFFAKERKMGVFEEGDHLAILSAGAYGFTMASTYNSRPKPAEILIKDGCAHVIRERETIEDLLKGESLVGA